MATSTDSNEAMPDPELMAALRLTESENYSNGGQLDTSDLSLGDDGGPLLMHASPSISVTTEEGDPADVEEATDDQDGEDLAGVMTNNKSVILQVLSQIRVGSDITKFVLPVFLLESRSLLEMYAEFFAHPHIIANVNDLADPGDRIKEVLRWYISSISASRRGLSPKKPYNPVLGETLHCYWDLPGGRRTPPDQQRKSLLESGPVPYCGYDSLALVAEQVSHHPPVSSFYCECLSKNLTVSGTIGTKTKFLGLSVKAQNNGRISLKYGNHGEEYVADFPNGYARSILTTPWFEFGGECSIVCAQSGYKAKVEFHTKSIRNSKRHRVTGEVFHKSQKTPVYKIEGEWNTVLNGKIPGGPSEVFFDSRANSTVRKKWKKLSALEPHDSRVVWQHVSQAINEKNAEAAADAKHQVEEKQRAETKERAKNGIEFEHRYFSKAAGDSSLWTYNNPLTKRQQQLNS